MIVFVSREKYARANATEANATGANATMPVAGSTEPRRAAPGVEQLSEGNGGRVNPTKGWRWLAGAVSTSAGAAQVTTGAAQPGAAGVRVHNEAMGSRETISMSLSEAPGVRQKSGVMRGGAGAAARKGRWNLTPWHSRRQRGGDASKDPQVRVHANRLAPHPACSSFVHSRRQRSDAVAKDPTHKCDPTCPLCFADPKMAFCKR